MAFKRFNITHHNSCGKHIECVNPIKLSDKDLNYEYWVNDGKNYYYDVLDNFNIDFESDSIKMEIYENTDIVTVKDLILWCVEYVREC